MKQRTIDKVFSEVKFKANDKDVVLTSDVGGSEYLIGRAIEHLRGAQMSPKERNNKARQAIKTLAIMLAMEIENDGVRASKSHKGETPC